jgi:hypothetical protein
MRGVTTWIAAAETVLRSAGLLPIPSKADAADGAARPSEQSRPELEALHDLVSEASTYPFRLKYQDELEAAFNTALAVHERVEDFSVKVSMARARKPGRYILARTLYSNSSL